MAEKPDPKSKPSQKMVTPVEPSRPKEMSRLEAAHLGYRKGYNLAASAMNPIGRNVEIGYRLYNRLTGKYPLEELARRVEQAQAPLVIDTTSKVPEYKRGGLVKKTRTKK